MADLKLIGAVAVKVRPDAKGFKEGARRQVLRELKGEEFDVVVNLDLDADGVKEKARRIVNDVKRQADETIGVKVGVDPDSLRKASADIGKVLKDFKLTKLKVDMDRDYLQRAGSKLNEALSAASAAGIKVDVSTNEGLEKAKKDIDDFINGENGQEVKLHPVLAGLQKAAAELAYTSRSRKVDFFVNVNQKSLAVAEGLLTSLAGLGILKSVGTNIEDVIVNFDKFALKTGGWTTAIANIANTLAFVGTSAFTIGEGVVQSIGLLATLPTALATVAAGVLINVAAFKDFGAAIDGDAEALAALPPAARNAANALRGTWTSIQKPVQAAFWEGMAGSMERFAKTTVPVLRDGLTRVADDVGRFNAGVLDSFEEIAKNGDLDKMFGNLEGFFREATAASKPFFDALNILGLRGSDYLPRFGTWLADISTRFKEWTEEADRTGKINEWIEKGVQSLKDMSSVGGSVVDMFKGITRAVNDAGGGGLPEFRDNMRRIADIMLAEPFRSRMATIFAGARTGASELNDGVKDLGRTLGEASGYVSDLLTGLGQIGGGLLSGVARVLDQLDFQTGTLEGVRDMKEALEDLTPSFEGIGRIIGNMSRVAGEIFKGVAPVINTIVGFLDRSVDKLAGNLEELAPALTGMVDALVTAATGPLGVVVDLLDGALDLFNDLPGPIQNVVGALGGLLLLRGPMGSFLGNMQSGWGKFADSVSGSSKTAEDSAKRIGDMVYYANGTVKKFDGAPMQKQMQGMLDKAKAVSKGIGSSLMSFAGGPWGLALAGAATAFTLMGDAAAKQKAKVDDLRTALDGQTGINAATEEVIATQLRAKDSFLFWEQASIADAAEKIGINLRDLQKYAEGVPESIDAVNEALDRASDQRNPFERVVDGLAAIQKSGMLSGAGGGLAVLLDKMFGTDFSKTTSGLQRVKDDLEKARIETEKFASQLGQPINAAAGILSAIDIIADKASTADEKLRAVNDILRQMNGDTSKEDAIQRSNDSIRGLRENVAGLIADAKKEKTALPDLFNNVTKQIDTTTAAGSALRTDVMNTASAMKTSAIEQALAMDDPLLAIKTLNDTWGTYRRDLATQLTLAGLKPEEVEAVLKQLDFPPGVVEVLLSGQSAEQMKADITALMADGKAKTDKPLVAKVDANPSFFNSAIASAKMRGVDFGRNTFTSTVDGNEKPLQAAIQQAKGRGVDFSRQDFKSQLSANSTEFNNKESAAKSLGNEFARSVFTGTINADGNALSTVTSIWDTVRNFAGRVFTATLETLTKGGRGEDGMIYQGGGRFDKRFQPQYFANGGFNFETPGPAKIYPASSTWRVFAEETTGGEAYIPLAASKRARSLEILDEVANRFGYELYAKGGIRGQQGSSEAPGGGMHIHVDAAPGVAYQYANEVARATATRFRDAQVLYDVA